MVVQQSQIAIVDDDPAMRRAVARLCGASDLPCRSFASAEEFLASDALEATSLLILDVHLPGLSGFELHEHLRLHGIALPVVFITGQDQPLNRERARRSGAAAYLTKPFPGDLLLNAVRSHAPARTASPFQPKPHTITPPHTP
jgi:FixJ family two-component response regulator